MTGEVTSPSDTDVTCARCEACCCGQEAVLLNDIEVPDHLIVINAQGERSMARLEDGCVKPWIDIP